MSATASRRGPLDSRLTAAVLAGGAGRRFGGDKLAASLGPGRVIDHTLGALDGVAYRTVVVGAGPGLEFGPEVVRIRDAEPAHGAGNEPAGPLAGIVAALEEASTPLVAVIAADMPLASAALLCALARAWAGEPAVLPAIGSRPEPLHAIYATAHRRAFRAAFDDGARSPALVCQQLGARVLSVEAVMGDAAIDPPITAGWHLDIDTPTDLRDVAERLRPRLRGERNRP